MGFFKPGWQSKNLQKALKSLETMTDQQALAGIVRDNSVLSDVRDSAVVRISDQQTLYRIVRDSSVQTSSRLRALDQITDQNLLYDIIKNRIDTATTSDAFEFIALRRIDSQHHLAHIVRDIDSSRKRSQLQKVKEAAIQRISNPSILIELNLLEKAAECLEDQSPLEHIALSKEKDDLTRIRAAKLLRNQDLAQSVFFEIAQNDKAHDLNRGTAVENLTDQKALAKIADLNTKVSSKAIKRLTDQRTLAHYLKKSNFSTLFYPTFKIDEEVMGRITDQSILMDLAHNAKDYEIRLEAADRVTDRSSVQGAYKKIVKATADSMLHRSENKLARQRLGAFACVNKGHILDENCRCTSCDELFHDWNGCICKRCGTEHDWKVTGSQRGTEGAVYYDYYTAKCAICGKTKEYKEFSGFAD